MKKTILKRSVASTLSFLMAFSTAVPNSVVYAEESGIESEIAQDYAATLSQTQNGTTSFVTDGNKTEGPTTHVQGDKVEVAVEPDEGFNTAKIEVKNTDGTVVASLEDGKVTANDKGNYTFEMHNNALYDWLEATSRYYQEMIPAHAAVYDEDADNPGDFA